MSDPLSKAPPPPPTAEQRLQRLKQKRLVISSVSVLFVLVAAWQVYDYVASAALRAEMQVQAGKKSLSPGHYEDAVKAFDQALKTDPASWSAYLQRGYAKQSLGKLDDALSDFQRALQIEPDLLDARIARAEIYREKGDARHAVEELTKVIELKPDMTAHYSRGLAHAEVGEHTAAIEDFTWVINQVRDAPFAFYARAKSKRALGDEKGAAKDEQSASSLNRGVVK